MKAVMAIIMAVMMASFAHAGTCEETRDDFWGYNVIVVNRMNEDVKALSYRDGYTGHYLRYTCYAGDIRHVHHVLRRLVIGNCIIDASELDPTRCNVVIIEEDGKVYLEYTDSVRR